MIINFTVNIIVIFIFINFTSLKIKIMDKISKEKKLAAKEKLLKVINSCNNLLQLECVHDLLYRFNELFVDDREDYSWYMELENAHTDKCNMLWK